jgi:glyoxylase-like metal-dependent hydrolase (beta-lactamase superfamily II)
MASAPQQAPGIYHRQVGDILVTAIHDGYQDAPLATVAGIGEEDAAAMLRAAFRPVPRRTQVQTFLIRSGDRIALVDTGCGPLRPSTGRVLANLAAAGVEPAQVDTLLMTHLHPDHAGGLVDAAGAALFPNAVLKLHADELAYWHDDAALARFAVPDRAQAMAATARKGLAGYRDRIETYTGGEVLRGVTAMPFPGHTPGHSGMMVASGEDALLIWADIVHVPELQVPRPEIGMMFDVDRAAAEATRRRVFDLVATDRLAFAGMHLHFPAFAHLARHGDGYALVPDAWSIDLRGDHAV